MSTPLHNGGRKSKQDPAISAANCDASWKLGILLILSVTKYGISIMAHCRCCGVITVLAASANSWGNWKRCPWSLSKWRVSTGLAKRNALHWPIVYFPQSMAGELVPFWTICFILLLQWILVRKENLGQGNLTALCYSKLQDFFCLRTSLGF